MSVSLRPVTRDNWEALIGLTVAEEQREFVASNTYTLAESYVYPACVPLGVYDGETPVGFCMYALDEDDGAYWVCRLMVDRARQRKGYGREALRLLIARVAALKPDKPVLYISFGPENAAAKALYESFGFAPDGRVLDGEVVYRLALPCEETV